MREVVAPVKANRKEYGLHSLGSGNDSAAGKVGVPDRFIQGQGRWRSNEMCRILRLWVDLSRLKT